MAVPLLDAPFVERRGAWALPPRPPETWIGSRYTVALYAAGLACAVLCLQPLAVDRSGRTVLVTLTGLLGCAAALTVAYVLLIQHSVTGDAELRWVAAGALITVPLVVGEALYLADADQAAGSLERAGPIALLALGVLPLVALTSAWVRLGLPLVLVPLNAVAALGLGIVLWPWLLALLVDPGGRPTPVLRGAFLIVGLFAAAGALRWWTGRPRGVRGPWVWIVVSLAMTALAALAHAVAGRPMTASWWTAVLLDGTTLTATALGLALVSAAGYRRQSRRWRQLVAQVGMLRAASPLLPGLSITPEDDDGLPGHAEVRALIDDGRVRVALQPVVRLADGEVVGFEALSRFGGRVPTDRWFRGASHCGLGGELERVTLHAALALLDQLPEEVFLAVNVSPAAVHDGEVVSLLHGCDLRRIIVEVTEHEAVSDYGATRDVLDGLRRAGARIAVDDTGAGFASLRHVLMLQPDIIKLDTSLTRDVQNNQRQQDLVVALATFAVEVGSTVLAEGIETVEQLDTLRGLQVPLGQGWHLGVPTIVG